MISCRYWTALRARFALLHSRAKIEEWPLLNNRRTCLLVPRFVTFPHRWEGKTTGMQHWRRRRAAAIDAGHTGNNALLRTTRHRSCYTTHHLETCAFCLRRALLGPALGGTPTVHQCAPLPAFRRHFTYCLLALFVPTYSHSHHWLRSSSHTGACCQPMVTSTTPLFLPPLRLPPTISPQLPHTYPPADIPPFSTQLLSLSSYSARRVVPWPGCGTGKKVQWRTGWRTGWEGEVDSG